MDILTNILGATGIVVILVTALARFLPNDKLYMWGFDLGKSMTSFGTKKVGYAWEKLEDFLINSLGVFLDGFRDGLNSDDSPEKKKPTPPKPVGGDTIRK